MSRTVSGMILSAALSLGAALPALSGDAVKGESEFRKCKACHSITAPDGTVIEKGGRTGPNLYGVIGRPVAADPDFSYGASIREVGATGLVWDEAALADYVADPGRWLKERLGGSGTSKMTFKLAKGGEDIAAWLASLPR